MNPRQLLNDDSAVSPVIGVILMVAITVILAAVIATLVLGLGQDVNPGVNAGVTVDGDNTTEATVTWTSEGNANYIEIRDSTGSTTSSISNIGGSVTVSSPGDYSAVAINEDSTAVVRNFEVT